MMLLVIIISCQKSKVQSFDVSSSVEKIMSVDDIYKCERIISDSSLMEAMGDTAWRRVNSQTIRIKIGSNYYIRRETKEGTVTDFTYWYE